MHPLTAFINQSPTPYHAASNVEKKLLKSGGVKLDEHSSWKLEKGGLFFVKRGGSLIAFKVPRERIKTLTLLASHTDSPALKLKPQAEFVKENMAMVAVDVYGAPLLSSWLNRDLHIAGRVLYKESKGKISEDLVNLKNEVLTIPQLAIHLDRKVNEEGLLLNKQEHLHALYGLNPPKEGFLLKALKKELPIKELLAHDLFLYPAEPCKLTGANNEFLSGYRLDNLASVYASLEAFLEKKSASLEMLALFDHEEIGSQTASGADSPFFTHALERALLSIGIEREEQLKLISQALCISIDLTHASHPNYKEKLDPSHTPGFEKGVYIKTSAQKRYATEAPGTKKLFEAAEKAKVKLQFFTPRNDIPSGSTIGPIHASLTGMETIDIGIAELSMHSIREILAVKDIETLKKLLLKI